MLLENRLGSKVAVLGTASVQKIIEYENTKTLVFVYGETPDIIYVDTRGMHPVRNTLPASVLDAKFSLLGIENPLPRVSVALDGYMNFPGNGAYTESSATVECRL